MDRRLSAHRPTRLAPSTCYIECAPVRTIACQHLRSCFFNMEGSSHQTLKLQKKNGTLGKMFTIHLTCLTIVHNNTLNRGRCSRNRTPTSSTSHFSQARAHVGCRTDPAVLRLKTYFLLGYLVICCNIAVGFARNERKKRGEQRNTQRRPRIG